MNEQKEANSTAESIVAALETGDRETLISLFSEEALAEADDLEQGIDYVFSLYSGEVRSIQNPGNETINIYGRDQRLMMIDGMYILDTTENKYRLYFILYTINETKPQMNGIYYLGLFDEDEVDSDDFINPMGYAPGIYYPERSVSYQRIPDYKSLQ
jgi:hypothetical protein